MTQKITRAVFPVAGLGTRFLPATKAIPKEMLPILDKPLIQYATEEAIAAGITQLVFIISKTKQAIVDHFDRDYVLEDTLAKKNKREELEAIQKIIPADVSCFYIRQAEPLGLGHAVLCAQPVIGDHPFAVILPDDLISSRPCGALTQITTIYEQQGHSIIAVEDVAKEETDQYGIVEITRQGDANRVVRIIEKPGPDTTLSTLAVVGRYILTPQIFAALKKTKPGAGGEIQLTDALVALLENEPIYAYRFAGKRYDCGSKSGYIQACVDYAAQDALKD